MDELPTVEEVLAELGEDVTWHWVQPHDLDEVLLTVQVTEARAAELRRDPRWRPGEVKMRPMGTATDPGTSLMRFDVFARAVRAPSER